MKIKFNAIFMAMLAMVSLFTSCSKDNDVVIPNIGFSQETFGIEVNNEAVLKVSSSAVTSGEVEYSINSTLVQGEDYTVDKKSFSFANSSEALVKVNFLKGFPENTKFEVVLKPVSFGTLALSQAKVDITTNDVILYTFDKPNYTMTASTDVLLQLSKVSSSYVAEKSIQLPIELDPTSTAVEGVHFRFTNGKTINIPAGQNKGTVKIELIKQEAGKDKIVLKIKELPSIFKPGNYNVANIVVFGSLYDKLEGSWAYKAMTNVEWWELNNQWTGDDLSLLPKKNSADDVLTFSEEGLSVSLKGDLKNYFRNSKVTNMGEVTERLQEIPGLPVPSVKILLIKALANVAFSTNTIKEREAEIGFRVFVEGGQEILEVTVRDYEPTDFLQKTYAMYKNFGDTPVMKSTPLRYHFVKKK